MIIHADILRWAEEYEGEPFHALLCDSLSTFGALYLRIGATMTRIAQGFEVANLVCFPVAVKTEQAKRLDVVNISTRAAATLTGVVITFQDFAPLGLPVWTAIVRDAAHVLRMVQSVPMLITTRARAIFTTAFARFQHALINRKSLTAVKASEVPNISGSWSHLH